VIEVNLGGKVALVTGAGRGIGLASARRLLEAEASVLVNVRTLEDAPGDAVRQLGAEFGERVVVVEGSVADPAVVDQAARTAFQRFRRLDIVVNNAGVMREAYLGMISEEDIQATLEVNLASVIRIIQATSRVMRRNKSGSIVNISSIIGRRGNAASLVYSASKAGVIGATYSAAKELGPQGIRVNAVAPGLIDTQMTAGLPGETRERLSAQIGLGRIGVAEDVADVVLFLASDLSRYVTGQVIGVDGGLVL
jgi:3-oxoacyl-[acyl-carrier protein] reductase